MISLTSHLCAALLLLLIPAHAIDPEQYLRDQYQGKIFMLRDWISGPRVNYDPSAAQIAVGDWTTDGFVRVDEIHFSGNRLRIRAMRQIVFSIDQKGFQFAPEKAARKTKNRGVVEIEALLTEDNLKDANAMWSKVFLTSQDSFIDLVPDYWKACVTDGFSGKNASCQFSSEISAVPGMTNRTQLLKMEVDDAARKSSTTFNQTMVNLHGTTHLGGSVKPPRLLHLPEPPYSEAARKMDYHGVVTLGLIVTKDGVPDKVHIVNPLGAGLDVNAVRTVERWRFKPAEKDGQPVAVQISVAVDFR